MQNLVIDAFIAIERQSCWNKENFSKDKIDTMSLEELREYAFNISCRFTDLGYELSRVCEAYETLLKYQNVK